MGELSVYELPWWERTDVSTYDNKCLSEEEQTKVRSTLDESKALLEEDFKQIESDVRSYMTTKPDEAEIIDLDSQRIKSKKWKPKIVK
jgi:lipoate-protein ligase A